MDKDDIFCLTITAIYTCCGIATVIAIIINSIG